VGVEDPPQEPSVKSAVAAKTKDSLFLTIKGYFLLYLPKMIQSPART
jgi:hypothetical protein